MTVCIGNRQNSDKIGTNFETSKGIAPSRIAGLDGSE